MKISFNMYRTMINNVQWNLANTKPGFGILNKSLGGGRIIDIDINQTSEARDRSVNHTIIEVPPNAIDPGDTVEIRYSIIADGPFRQPLYCFHLDFWYVTLVQYIYIYIYNTCSYA